MKQILLVLLLLAQALPGQKYLSDPGIARQTLEKLAGADELDAATKAALRAKIDALSETDLGYRPEAYGAAGDGVTDDTADFQELVDAMPARGGKILLGNKTYLINGTVNINKPVSIEGHGVGGTYGQETQLAQTKILRTTTTGVMLDVTKAGFGLRDLAIYGPTSATAGSAIRIRVTTFGEFNLDRITIFGFYDQVYVEAAALWKVSNSTFSSFKRTGFEIDDQENIDAGDSGITNCVFAGDIPGSLACVNLVGGGGLRLTGNKFLADLFTANKSDWGIRINVRTQSTGILQIIGNSIENFAVGGILLTGQGVGSGFIVPVIASNEIATCPTGINLFEYITAANIHGNTIIGSTTRGIYIGSVTDTSVGTNSFHGCAKNIVISSQAAGTHVDQQISRSVFGAALIDNGATLGLGKTTGTLRHERALDPAIYTPGNKFAYIVTFPPYGAGTIKAKHAGIMIKAGVASTFSKVRNYAWVSQAGVTTLTAIDPDLDIGVGSALSTLTLTAEPEQSVMFINLLDGTYQFDSVVSIEVDGQVKGLIRGQ